MKIVTYNILADCTLHHFKNPHAPELKREARTKLIIDALKTTEADIICLQEVDQIVFNVLHQALTDYPSFHFTLNRDGRFGLATFIKTKDIVEWTDIDFNDTSGRLAQVAKFADCTFINVHLDFKQNREQIHSLIRNPGISNTCLISGDFNASINSATLRVLKEAQFDTLPTGPTVNTNGRAKVIDFIMARGYKCYHGVKTMTDITALTPLPSSSQGSDHVPVIAEIRL